MFKHFSFKKMLEIKMKMGMLTKYTNYLFLQNRYS